jgi:hypothetical protein
MMKSAPEDLTHLAAGQLDRLRAFLARNLPEGPNLDYKLEIAGSLARAVAAMANTDGGVIIIGVDENPTTKTPVDVGGTELRDVRGRISGHLWRYLDPVPAYQLVAVGAEEGRSYAVLIVEPCRQRIVLHADSGVLVRHGDMSVAPNRADLERLLGREADRSDRILELTRRRDGAAGIEAAGIGSAVSVFAFMDPADPADILFGPEVDVAFRGAVATLFEEYTESYTAPSESVITNGGVDYFRLSDTGELFCRYDVNRLESGRAWPPEGQDAVRAIDIAADLIRLLLIPFELAKRDASLVSLPIVVTAGVGGYIDKALVTNIRHAPGSSRPASPPRIVRTSTLERPGDTLAVAQRIITDVGRALQVPGPYDWTKGLGGRVVLTADPKLNAWKSALDHIE